MGRPFNDHLDRLLAEAKGFKGLPTPSANSLEAHIANALYAVEPSAKCRIIAEQVFQSGEALLAARGHLILKNNNTFEAALKRFEADVEALRAELENCPASPIMRALLLE